MRDEWVKDYQSGMSSRAVAKKYGADQAVVWRHLSLAGVMRSRGPHVKKLRAAKEEVIAAYQEHNAMSAVARLFEVPEASVRKVLIEWGIPRCAARSGRARIRATEVKIGRLGAALDSLPEDVLDSLVEEARQRGKSISQVLVDDWGLE